LPGLSSCSYSDSQTGEKGGFETAYKKLILKRALKRALKIGLYPRESYGHDGIGLFNENYGS
jgi:hypothetical protein